MKLKASIKWIPDNLGGRKNPPRGNIYSTVARFSKTSYGGQGEDWSMVIESSKPLNESDSIIANVRLLFPENAPAGLLSPGNKFKLLEGQKIIAIGEMVIE